jgi:hypothetical protein
VGINEGEMMQLWEYLTLTVREGIVKSANGERLAKDRFWGGIEGQDLPDFLNDVGRLGWEVIGISPITSGGVGPFPVELVVILKRPLQQL